MVIEAGAATLIHIGQHIKSPTASRSALLRFVGRTLDRAGVQFILPDPVRHVARLVLTRALMARDHHG
jgi:hypothetical protein